MKHYQIRTSKDKFDKSISVYTSLFGSQPAVQTSSYAQWHLENPRMEFSILAKEHNHHSFLANIRLDQKAYLAILGGGVTAKNTDEFYG